MPAWRPNRITYTYEPLSLRGHIATVMAVMAGVVAVGTWLTRLAVLCDYETGEQYCQPTPPAVAMLIGLGLVAAAALLLGALLLWAPLRHRIDPARYTPTRPGPPARRARSQRPDSAR